MDEPLSNLDAKLRVQMRTEVARLQQQLGTTMIYVTHDQTEAMTLGDRVAVMRSGVLQQVGSPMELYDAPVNLFVAGFIGSPAMNFMPATVEGDTVKLPFGDVRLPRSCATARATATGRASVIAGHPARALRGRRAGGRRQGPRLDLPGADRGGRVDGLRAVRTLHGRDGGRSSPTSCASWPRTPAAARSRARARAASSPASTRRPTSSEGQEAELWVDASKLHLFDPDDGRKSLPAPAAVERGRRRQPATSLATKLPDLVSSSSRGSLAARAQALDHVVVPVVGAQEQIAQVRDRRVGLGLAAALRMRPASRSISTTGSYSSRNHASATSSRRHNVAARLASHGTPRPRRASASAA